MIHKIKTYEVRSHGFFSRVSNTGKLLAAPHLFYEDNHLSKAYVRRVDLHLQEVLKCMKKIAKDQEAKNALKIVTETTPGQEAKK